MQVVKQSIGRLMSVQAKGYQEMGKIKAAETEASKMFQAENIQEVKETQYDMHVIKGKKRQLRLG